MFQAFGLRMDGKKGKELRKELRLCGMRGTWRNPFDNERSIRLIAMIWTFNNFESSNNRRSCRWNN